MRWFACAVAAVVVVSLAPTAHADCAEGSFYQVDANQNTVTIGLENSDRSCGDASGMLRQDEATGEVVQIANYCVTAQGETVYEDECVPPGTYRYGLAVPYDCSMSGCGGVEYFQEVTVTAALPTPCARAASDPGPTSTTAVPPWGTNGNIRSVLECPSHGCACDTATAAVVSMNSGALAVGLAALALARRRRRRA